MTDPARVLVVVEDEPDMRLMMKALLGSDPRIEIAGEAVSAEEAVAVVTSVRPHLVILDHSIEGDVMGLEAAPMIRAAAPHAKIILFSAFDLRKEAEAEPAIDAFLGKTEVGRLLGTVQSLLDAADAPPASDV